MTRYLMVSLGAVLLFSPLLLRAAGYPVVESKISSDGSWTVFSFPPQIAPNAKITVKSAECETPKLKAVQFVLVSKGKCAGAAGSARPKGAKALKKIKGASYTLSAKDLCAGAEGPELRCTIYADTEW
jgi:hypothetical protein